MYVLASILYWPGTLVFVLFEVGLHFFGRQPLYYIVLRHILNSLLSFFFFANLHLGSSLCLRWSLSGKPKFGSFCGLGSNLLPVFNYNGMPFQGHLTLIRAPQTLFTAQQFLGNIKMIVAAGDFKNVLKVYCLQPWPINKFRVEGGR